MNCSILLSMQPIGIDSVNINKGMTIGWRAPSIRGSGRKTDPLLGAAMKLTCFSHVEKPLRLVPAASKRPWMDTQANRHSYRCLPLKIANTYGWHLLSPYQFSASYHGGADTSAIDLYLPDGEDPSEAFVQSHFGHGILTFRTGYVIRTQAGWHLMTCGPANSPKDGIDALSGLVETDWLPYPFTINWKFTRPGNVSFAQDEPIAQLIPVMQHALEWIEPEVRSIDEDPRLKRQFEDWWRKRNDYTEASLRGSKEWQRDYMRGEFADGTKAPRHQSKIAIRCPIDHKKLDHRRLASLGQTVKLSQRKQP